MVSSVASPYDWAEPHSRFYLLRVMKSIDPTLFPGDQIVDAISLYTTIFYDFLTGGFLALAVPLHKLEDALTILFLVLLFCKFLLIFNIAKLLDDSWWFFVLLAIWSSQHQEGIVGGGAGLFLPSLTHREIAQILALLALYLFLKGHHGRGGLVLGSTVFVHALVGLHMFLATVPVLLLQRKNLKGVLRGAVAVLVAAGCYLLFLAPPPLSPEAAKVFLEVTGNSGHFSLFANRAHRWVLMAGTLALALLVRRRVDASNRDVGLLEGFALSAVSLGLLLSVIAHLTGSAQIARFQPLRLFVWATAFLYVVLIWSASKTLAKSPILSAILVGVVSFRILDVASLVVFIGIGILYLCLRRQSSTHPVTGDWPESAARGAIVLTVCLLWINLATGGFVTGLASAVRAGAEQLSDRGFSAAVGAGLCSLAFLPASRFKLRMGIALVTVLISLCGSSWRGREERIRRERVAADWQSVMLWCRTHTDKTDRFLIPAEAGGGRRHGFRFYARRVPVVGELQGGLRWVDPLLARSLGERQESIREDYRAAAGEVKKLLFAARKWGANYAIVSPPNDADTTSLYRNKGYAVYTVDKR